MSDDVGMALSRYEAMAGLLQGVPAGVERRADADREAFGGRYLYHDDAGVFRWSTTHVLRFLVEVCGLSYMTARAAVVRELRQFQRAESPLPDPISQAHTRFKSSSDILVAIEEARIEVDAFSDDPSMASHAREILFYLESLSFTPEFDGKADWN